MGEFKYEIEYHKNGDVFTIHINKIIPQEFRGWLGGDSLSEEIKPLYDSLMSIPGVVYVSFTDKYKITIEKGRVFSFGDVEVEAKGIILNYFHWGIGK